MSAGQNGEIMCIGEILWDSLPRGLYLGGAPFNVACHLQSLGEQVVFVSRVGGDVLGTEARRRLRNRGLSDALVQIDRRFPTGFVEVKLSADGIPSYVIVEPAAWDRIALTEDLVDRAVHARAIVFGSLAQRGRTSRATLRALLDTEAVKVFDVNLRPPYLDKKIVAASLEAADIVKCNMVELEILSEWFGLPNTEQAALHELTTTFHCESVCLTRGSKGAVFWADGEVHVHDGYHVIVEDTVGTGDAFLAALLSRRLQGRSAAESLDFANRLGAFVATRQGGTPSFSDPDLSAVQI